MIVVIADYIPPAVRGRMKLWFIEPRPNVFVSGVKDAVARQVVDYLFESCNDDSGLLVIEDIRKAPYYKIMKKGFSLNKVRSISGLPLIFNKNSDGQE